MVDKNKDGIDDLTGKPVKPKKKPEGINALWNGLGNFNADVLEKLGNGADQITNFFTGQPQGTQHNNGFTQISKGIRDSVYTTPRRRSRGGVA